MLSPEFLDMLRCPDNRSRLAIADAGLIDKMNRAIAGGKLKNRAGQPVQAKIDSGLVREDQQVLYPIVQDIPILLVDDGIPLDQVQ